ncbi:MAG: Ig-like domain-containing protein [Chitinophagaceae bacterium]|nr:Ig-like domain-containing protein [Chitinophagaceae bacterium]
MKTNMLNLRLMGKLFLLLPAIFLGLFSNGQSDVIRPTVTSVSPANFSIGLNSGISVSANFSEAMNATTISNATFEVRNSFTNALIPATVIYNATTKSVRLYPASPLDNALLYTAKVKGGTSGVKDLAGNAMVTDYVWYFVIIPLYDFTAPTVLSVSPSNGATGVSITPTITGLFSEEMKASTIIAATVELRNAANVLIPSTVTYNNSMRSVALVPSGALVYGTTYKMTIKGGTGGVKDATGNSMAASYSWSFTTVALPSDVTRPSVTSVSPANGTIGVNTGTAVTAVFSEAMNSATINTGTVELRSFTSNALVTSTVAYNTSNKTVTLTPSAPLAAGVLYMAIVKGGASGAKDLAGNSMISNYTWTFTTNAGPVSIFGPTDVPAVPVAYDQPVEVGTRFRTTQNGHITGLKFYKGAGNDGTHIGHLWTGTGIQLAEVLFINETPSGWQEVTFATPVAIAPGTTYVASYYSTAGLYAYTNNYFTTAKVNGPLRALADGEDGGNGLYQYSPVSTFPTNTYLASNYFVDVVFQESPGADDTPPAILIVSAPHNATSVSTTVIPSASFNEPVSAETINSNTMELRDASGAIVSAEIVYDAASNTATLIPSEDLSYATSYTARVKGGLTGVKDLAGNPLPLDKVWTFTTTDQLISPAEGPGGPILVLGAASNPFSKYAVEILRAEGLNEFATAEISTITTAILNAYDVIVLGEVAVTSAQATLLTSWVNSGGTLIGFKPSSTLNSLFGLANATGTLSDQYLLVNTAAGFGAGIVNQTIQFHGTANLHTLVAGSGASAVATLYSNATTATVNPAVTKRSVGSFGGLAVAFTYDLAKSIVYTRQGNPAWAGQKRDGEAGPIRSDDLFFPNWIDFNKIAIPQADEQQRLLANIIIQGNLHRKPLPRFWYLPRDLKAAIVMTGDDHYTGGTTGRFNQYLGMLPGSNNAQDVADWKAIRGTSYIYTNTPISNAEAVAFEAQGFELALHPNNGCVNYTLASLQNTYSTQLAEFRAKYTGIAAPSTNRMHCLAWSDWASQPKVQSQNGIRFDVSYYYWPEVWMQNRPGMFTGSGMPMRFADVNGAIIDVYQAPTQMTDETNMNYTNFCNAVLNKALGAEGYYGVFTANMHTDNNPSAGSDAIIASAIAHNVPVVSSKQMLTWLDSRNNSFFSNMVWDGSQLNFSATAHSSARNLKAMLPFYAESGQLISITRNGTNVPFTTQTIKGLQYAFFPVIAGTANYVATYENALRTTTNPGDTTVVYANEPVTAEKAPAEGLFIKAMPNPSTQFFNVVINSNDPNPVTVRVTDMTGRVVETHQRIASTGILRIGHNWGAGTYIAEVVQGDRRQIVKMVKVN